MKKNFILLISIFLISFAFGGLSFEGHGLRFLDSGSLGATEYSGVRILALQNITIYRVDFASGITGTRLTVFNESIIETPDARLNQSVISSGSTNINASLVAGQYYFLVVNTTTGASWTHNCSGGTVPATFPPIRGVSVSWVNGSVTSGGNIITASLGNLCNVKEIYYRDNYLGFNSSIYNLTTIETSSESFYSNFSSSTSISSANLIYNNTQYSATVTDLGGGNYALQKTIDIPLGSNPILANQWFWNLTYFNGTTVSSSVQSQYFTPINLSICGASPQNIVYLNFTFKNETASQEVINASITSSSFNYRLGSGTTNRTLTYVSASENRGYTFCFSPSHKSINVDLELTYDNSESEQRIYSPSTLSLSNSTTFKVLYLLPTIQGQYVTFQVINTAQQSLSGVEVTATRSGIGVVETALTDSSGSVTFFLNPSFTYDFVFSKDGFNDFETSIMPSQTSYTITMGGSSPTTNSTNSASGMSFIINPSINTLNNGTSYNFNLTLNSTFWSLDSWGYTLRNASGFTFLTQSSTSSSGGILSSNLNTGSNKTIVINYFWVINGVYNNATRSWGVVDLSGNGLSIFQFFTDLRNYVSLGFFGLDDVGLGILTFLSIFLTTGVMTYKFGINSPASIMAFIFSLTMFFDIGLGLVPNPIGAIPHAPTFFMGIIMVAMVFREMGR